MAHRFRTGIDLGGTKIEAAAVDRFGAVRVRRRVATPTGNYHATTEAITALVAMIELEIGETAPIGVGMPGAISPITGLVKNANSTCLIGRPLPRDLESALGRPTRLANDANCFVLSEATDGAAAGMGDGLRCYSRHRGRRRHRPGRADPRRRQLDRRRVGPQPTALAGAERDPGTVLLLRALGLYRDLSFRAGSRGRSLSSYRASPECARDRLSCQTRRCAM